MKNNYPLRFRNMLFLLMGWLVCMNALAQERRITGRVTDGNDNSGLPGANVVVKGTQIGMVTDAQGKFSLSVPSNNNVLTISAIGFTTQEVTIGNRTDISIALAPDIKTLSEVVVTGYGAQAKRDITGAVATVDTKQLLSVPATNVG